MIDLDQLRLGVNGKEESFRLRQNAADEIERLRAELTKERELKQGWIDEWVKLRDMGSPNLED